LTDVSVVLPTYNRANLVGRAITSVIAQSFKDWELLVIDDGSTDETVEVVKGFVDGRVTYVRRQANGGVSAAQNEGVARARGPFISFLHSDDEFLPSKLEEQVALLESARRELLRSVSSWPWSVKRWLLLGGSLLGPVPFSKFYASYGRHISRVKRRLSRA
jgi:glycosyltransferase involved in cell wall biosynthesis